MIRAGLYLMVLGGGISAGSVSVALVMRLAHQDRVLAYLVALGLTLLLGGALAVSFTSVHEITKEDK